MRTRRVLGLAVVFGLSASLAAAAPRKATPARPPSPDLFAGYSYTHAGDPDLHGVGLSGSYPVGPRLGLVVDLSAHRGSFAGADLGQQAVMAGARWSPSTSRLRPFAEGLLGAVRTSASVDAGGVSVSDSDWDWGVALGGGVDYRLDGRWSVRALFHLRMLQGEGAWDADPRFAVGAVCRLER